MNDRAASTFAALRHGASAAFVAVFAYATASLVPFLHETYWAPIAAVVVLYPDRAATRKAAFERFVGTLIGSAVGWAGAVLWHHHALLYGVAVMVGVGLCYLLRLENAARLCAVAVTVITIIPRAEPAHVVAFFRCVEVTYGVACALLFTVAAERLSRPRRPLPVARPEAPGEG